MQINRSGDVDRGDLRILDHLLPVRVPAASANLTREPFGQLGTRATDRDQLAILEIAKRRRDPLAGDVTTADQSPTNSCHRFVSLNRFGLPGIVARLRPVAR